MRFQVVISRYNEDLSWIRKIDLEEIDIFIYNKGEEIKELFSSNVKIINLENIGRESHTYLHHIINKYEELSEKTVFTQAHPNDHVSEKFISEFLSFKDDNLDFRYFSKNILDLKIHLGGLEESGMLNGSFWRNNHSFSSCCFTVPSEIIPGIKSKKWVFGTGAIFGVSKKSILKNSREFYEKCLEILEKSSDPINPPEGHAFERSWYLIFN